MGAPENRSEPYEIRPVTAADWSGWRVLWEGYLRFYREELGDDVTRHTFERLCDAGDDMFGFVAERSGELVGTVHALLHSSTWSTANYCYLEDLFVSPAARGTRIARDLIERVATEATARGAEKVYWHTHEFNGPARTLYDQVAKRVSFVVYEREL